MLQQKHIKQLTTLGYLTAGLLGILLIISAVERKGENRVVEVFIDIEPLPDGSTLIQKKEVEDLILLSFGSPLVTQPAGEVDMERLERVLERNSFVLDAETFMDAKYQIFIRITPREPVLRVRDNNKLDYFLDKSGVRMDPSKHTSPHVLVLTGNLPPYTSDFLEPKKEHMLKDMFYLSKMIWEDELLGPLVEQIDVGVQNELILVPKIGPKKIFFGRLRDAEDKLRRLKIFYREATPYEGWHKYKSLDLRFRGQVVAKK